MGKIFFIILILQILLYGLADYKKAKYGRSIILGIFFFDLHCDIAKFLFNSRR